MSSEKGKKELVMPITTQERELLDLFRSCDENAKKEVLEDAYQRITKKKEQTVDAEFNINLDILLNEVVNEFGKNQGYEIPRISWSKENMLFRFAEYQFANNHIIISRLLNSHNVSERAIKSIIYHEYCHQIEQEHNGTFEKMMNRFKDYEKYVMEIENYFNSLQQIPQAESLGIQLDRKEEIIFCRINIPIDREYYEDLVYFNHNIYGLTKMNEIAAKYCDDVIKQVIWLAEDENGRMVTVGWATNVHLCKKIKTLEWKECYLEQTKYQYFHFQNEGTYIPQPLVCLNDNEIPKELKKMGICSSKEIDTVVLDEIVDMINEYDSEIIERGMDDNAIDCIPGVECIDVDKLIYLARQHEGFNRSVWIMNKAVSIEKSFKTYYVRGMMFYQRLIFDRAKQDFLKAMNIGNGTDEERKNILRILKRLESF